MSNVPVDSITQLTQELVRLPSRVGVDSYEDIFEFISQWLHARGVWSETLRDNTGRTVALWGEATGLNEPAYLLNAPLDTATFGDETAWSRSPTSGDIEDGWLYGRGSADCKVAVAMFSHIIAELGSEPHRNPSRIAFLFDTDEHDGTFVGVKSFLSRYKGSVKGAMIGYPGSDRVVVGSRGFWRADLEVRGESAHSGASTTRGANAVSKAARLVDQLEQLELGTDADEAFPLPPQLTVTGVRGGGDFSLVPDICTLSVDIRLTPHFDALTAESLVRGAAARVDEAFPTQPTTLEVHGGWPAYRLPQESSVAHALQTAAGEVFGRKPPLNVVGPSNTGNYLAQRGIEATCGFGVTYRNIHAADECFELASVEPVYLSYLRALQLLVNMEPGPRDTT